MNVYDLIPPESSRYEAWGRTVVFRSRLEYRWALMFDRLHLGWEYEPRYFALQDGSIYTPDFLVDGVGWIEIKPNFEALLAAEWKLRLFARHTADARVFSIHASAPYFRGSVVEWTPDGIRPLSEKQAGAIFCSELGRNFRGAFPDLYGAYVAKSCDLVREAIPGRTWRLHANDDPKWMLR